MSHHFDSPTAVADGRINLCDLFVFPGAPGTTTLILTVNPDAGRSSATTFRPDALYEFEYAFNRAFTRHRHLPPGRYRTRSRAIRPSGQQ